MNDEAYMKGLAKYCNRWDDVVNNSDWELACSWLARDIGPIVRDCNIITIEDSIKNLDSSTSPGPLGRMFAKNKGEFLSDLRNLEWISQWCDSLTTPGAPLTYWGGHLKDEIRLSSKVQQNKTRLFMNAPIEHVVGTQMYCLDFNGKLIAAAKDFKTPICVGMNMYGGSFEYIHRRLAKRSIQFFMDVSGWDSRYKHLIFFMVIRIRYEMMRNCYKNFGTQNAFCNIYRDIIWTPLVLPNGDIVMVPHAPSGHGNTAIDNSLGLYLMEAYAFIRLTGIKNYDEFKENVDMFLFGDDSCLGVDKYEDQFNPDTIMNFYRSEWDIEVEFSEHWEFLGHFFSPSPYIGAVVPVFPFEKIYASLVLRGEHNVDTLIEKAFNLRILAFSNTKAYNLVDDYCRWLLEQYPSKKEKMYSMYMSVSDLERLYLGRY